MTSSRSEFALIESSPRSSPLSPLLTGSVVYLWSDICDIQSQIHHDLTKYWQIAGWTHCNYDILIRHNIRHNILLLSDMIYRDTINTIMAYHIYKTWWTKPEAPSQENSKMVAKGGNATLTRQRSRFSVRHSQRFPVLLSRVLGRTARVLRSTGASQWLAPKHEDTCDCDVYDKKTQTRRHH